MEILTIILLGVTVGFLSSFFGIGGGSLIVPILYIMYQDTLTSLEVIAISLSTIFLVTTTNIYKFKKESLLPPVKSSVFIALFCIIGAYIGNQFIVGIDTKLAKKITACVLIIICLKLLLYKAKPVKEAISQKKQHMIISITALLGSFLSSITGLGGGIIFTPFFMSFGKVDALKVSAYSNVAMMIATLIGFVPYLFLETSNIAELGILNKFFIGKVNVAYSFSLALFAIIGSTLGIRVNKSLKSDYKKYILAVFISLVAIRLIL